MGIYQRELEPEFSIVDPPKNNSDLENEITLLAGHINAATYRFLKLIAEFDKREAWGDFGIKSCAHWSNWKCGIAILDSERIITLGYSALKNGSKYSFTNCKFRFFSIFCLD